MEFLPSLTKVKEIADCGKYSILPVSCEILSDICTPIEALRILKNVSQHCYILESVAGNEIWGRYTFLGFDAKMVIAFDNFRQKIILIVNMSLDDYESGYNKAIFELTNLKNLLLCGEKKKMNF